MKKYTIIIFPFIEMPYSVCELEYMIPGIIHEYFDISDQSFDELILDYVMPIDKGNFEIRRQYYDHMAIYVLEYLKSINFEARLNKLIRNYHYIEFAEIIKFKYLLLNLSYVID